MANRKKDHIEPCKSRSPYVWECHAVSQNNETVLYYRAFREEGYYEEEERQYELEGLLISRCLDLFGSCAWYSVTPIENPN